ncbi:MAG: aconitase X catalytic domain-containing protein [Gemmatimonadota bacterium]|nr:aconitase X catalytic domain-containing protein [Gemmatimonadota bacterium]
MSTHPLHLTEGDQALLAGEKGAARQLAMRLVTDVARILGAERLVTIESAHIDGCLHHGDGGVEFAERLVELGGSVDVPTTLNVGALDLLKPERIRSHAERKAMALRQMKAYEALGCRPTWTCAPYQVGHRPGLGQHVAWGESNAVAFANSVLGARTNRYGDFMDICCALTRRAPETGLHTDEGRRARVHIDVGRVNPELLSRDVFYPVLGTWLGRTTGDRIPALTGLPPTVSEDQLKALGAAAASSGSVGLFHVVGVTPEAPTLDAALGGRPPDEVIGVDPQALKATLDSLSTSQSRDIRAVALGSPHFSDSEFRALEERLPEGPFAVPFYVCTSRSQVQRLTEQGRLDALTAAGVEVIADTCVVVTPILAAGGGVLMTNSGKFAHYTPANTGYDVVYGSLEDCIRSAQTGTVSRDEALWR